MRTQSESRRFVGSNTWLEPLENRTLMAAHAAPESVALKSAPPSEPTVTKLVTGLAIGSGSTVGPNGDLFLTEGATGRVLEVNPRTGAVSTFADGLPTWVIPGIGGPMDVEFIGDTAYVLMTAVGSDLGGHDVVGVYRIDGPHSHTVIADTGAFSLANPPHTSFFVPTGVPYSMESYHGDLIVADGHHNRVLQVTLDGGVSEIMTFGNIVPTGLAIKGNTVYLTQAGPIPHLPENGKVVSFRVGDRSAELVASGAPLLVDVEFGRGNTMYALAQGPHTNPMEGSPSDPNGGSLVRANRDGTFTVIVDKLNQPTSMEIIGDTAYVVMLSGEVWKVANLSGKPNSGGHDRDGRGGDGDRSRECDAGPSNAFFDDRGNPKGHRALFA
jgi:hypothetical protein